MPFSKITYAPEYKRAHIWSYTCNFRCSGCPYRAGRFVSIEKPIQIEEVKKVLKGLRLTSVNFLGKEPTTNPDLQEIAEFCHEELDVHTRLLTNGSNPVPEGIDAVSISIKAYTERLHLDYTGVSNASVLKNFIENYRRGLELRASSVFIPDYIDFEEIEKIAKFISGVDSTIPYHIIGFIPFVNSWRAPTLQEIKRAVSIARKYLETVTFSLPNSDLKNYPSSLPDSKLKYKFESIRVA